ncbi:MAG: redoxin domain-containing protein [Candidatus Eisenbacteria bacterium]
MKRQITDRRWLVLVLAVLAVSIPFGCGGKAETSLQDGDAQAKAEESGESGSAGEPAATPSRETEAESSADDAQKTEAALPTLTPVEARTALPEFEMRDLNGRSITHEDLQGEVVLLVFWATWCKPCQMEIPQLVDLHKTYSTEGLRIVAPSIDRSGLAVVKPFIDRHPEIKYAIVPNGMPASMALGGISRIPTSFLIDRKGRVITHFVGLMSPEVLHGYVKAALREA